MHLIDVLNKMAKMVLAEFGAGVAPNIPQEMKRMDIRLQLPMLRQTAFENSVRIRSELSISQNLRQGIEDMWTGISRLISACEMCGVKNLPTPEFRTVGEFRRWCEDLYTRVKANYKPPPPPTAMGISLGKD